MSSFKSKSTVHNLCVGEIYLEQRYQIIRQHSLLLCIRVSKICYSFSLSSLNKHIFFFLVSALYVSSVSSFTLIRLFSHLNPGIWDYKKIKKYGITIPFTLQHCSFRHFLVVGFEILSVVFRNVDRFLLIYTASHLS